LTGSREFAPVVLFAYNRPDHLRRTVDSLRENSLAKGTDVIAFSDGAKKEGDAAAISAIRGYLKAVTGFRSIKVIERARNFGLSRSVVDGVTEVLRTYDRAIIVEDDLILSSVFLGYMNDALDRYAEVEQVMHISGYMYPIDATGLPETFVSRLASCWGWGTWRRAWLCFEPDVGRLITQFDAAAKFRFNVDGVFNFWEHMEQQQQGKIDSWAIRWYASTFLNGGLCLHPSISLVLNAGSDGSGTHSGKTKMFDGMVRQTAITEFSEDFNENVLALQRIKRFLDLTKGTLWKRMLKRLIRISGTK